MDAQPGRLPDGLWEEVMEGLKVVEDARKAKFGDVSNPLLVSVRSGAAVSMPGMMDTVLNVGCNDEILKTLAKTSGDRFANDCYRRLLSMFGDVVLGLPHEEFEDAIEKVKASAGVKTDVELSAADLGKIITAYKGIYTKYGKELPQDPKEQLRAGILAVFG